MTPEEIQEMHERMAPARKRQAERLARRAQEGSEAWEVFNDLPPEQQFLARCGASLDRLNARFPVIDPEADIDRPGQDEWKDVERYQL